MSFQLQPSLEALVPDLQAWFDTEAGQELLGAEQCLIDQVLPTLFGYHLIQVGVDSRICLYGQSPVRNKFIVAPKLELGLRENSVVADSSELPLEQNSMDVVILHHTLDFAQSPHQVLRESARILRPGGHLLLVGFNPLSLWGVYRRFCGKRCHVPWNGHFIGHRRLSDWFQLLELTELKRHSEYFRMPFENDGWRRRFHGVERWGRGLFKDNGAFTLMLARKDVAGMTPIKAEWARNRLMGLPVAEPSIRGQACEKR
ncbi:MAG: class I SAM-dependent methyltransferase [Pontibacterium sp.]